MKPQAANQYRRLFEHGYQGSCALRAVIEKAVSEEDTEWIGRTLELGRILTGKNALLRAICD